MVPSPAAIIAPSAGSLKAFVRHKIAHLTAFARYSYTAGLLTLM